MEEKRTMQTQLEVIDRALNKVRDRKRIFYIQADNREILFKALDRSYPLWARIKALGRQDVRADDVVAYLRKGKALPEGTPRNYLKKNGLLRDWSKMTGSRTVEELSKPVCWYIQDFHVFQEEANRLVKTYLDCEEAENSILLITSPVAMLPMGFADNIELIPVKPINPREIGEILEAFLKRKLAGNGKQQMLSRRELDAATKELLGFSEVQLACLLDDIYAENGGIENFRAEGLPELKRIVREERRKQAEKDGTITFDEKQPMVDGMENYMEWLLERVEIFIGGMEKARELGIPPIKGVLFTGLPGTGKTEMARKTAEILEVPLVDFKLESLQSKDFGGSETRLARYLDQLDAIGSCVMLVDEVEKIFHKNTDGQEMHEVKQMMMKQLLRWMQENQQVFCFFTSNRIEIIPDELIRPGRLNERFVAFLPTAEEVESILHAQLRKMHRESGERLFAEDLVAAIQKRDPKAPDAPSLGRDVLLEALKRARVTGRSPFLTGTDVVKLLENTNIAMDKKFRRPYRLEDYREMLVDCLCDKEFVCFAESSPGQVARLWLYTRENSCKCVSKSFLLEAGESEFVGGRFTDDYRQRVEKQAMDESLDWAQQYAAWFAKRFMDVIERAAGSKIR